MANALFNPGREGFLDGSITWNATPTIKAILMRSYVFDPTHKFYSQVIAAGGAPPASGSTYTLTAGTRTVADGVADAADALFTAVPSGVAIPALVIVQTSAVTGGIDLATTLQRLIAFIDTATGLPVTPNNQNITVAWDNGANKIFKL